MNDTDTEIINEIEVERKDGSIYHTTAHAQFNKGYSFIILDDGCYQIVNGNKISSHIFPEALEVLKTLPDPRDIKFKEKELIESIKKVSLEKNDILMLQVGESTTQEHHDRLCNLLDGLLPKEVKFLILPKTIDINVINIKDFSKGEMN